jgi:hypothetical protein
MGYLAQKWFTKCTINKYSLAGLYKLQHAMETGPNVWYPV